MAAWDELAPMGSFATGAIHELLTNPSEPMPMTVALWMARGATDLRITGKGTCPCHPVSFNKPRHSEGTPEESSITAKGAGSFVSTLRMTGSVVDNRET